MRKILTESILLLVILVFSAGIVAAPPAESTLPHSFYGTITGAPAELTITANVGGVNNKGSFTLTTAGVYGCEEANCTRLQVCADGSCTEGAQITFTASSGTISTTSTYDAGAVTELNLAYTAPADAGTGGGTGGGGGGGGVEALPSETSTTPSIAAGGSGTFEFEESEDLGVTSITIVSSTGVSNPSVTVEEDAWTGTAAIAAASGGVYKYLEITKTVLTNDDIESVTISFKVPKSWFTENNYHPDTVVLNKYVNDAWMSLDTSMTNSDADYYYYQAQTDSLSIFAITAKKDLSAIELLDMIRDFYAGNSSFTALELLDKIRAYYGG